MIRRNIRPTAFCLLLASAIALGGCTAVMQPSAMVENPSQGWRGVVTDDDSKRLRNWRSAFVGALARASRGGHGADIAREGALLNPDAALGKPAVPNGTYRCRMFKLGAKSDGLLDYVTYPAFTCVVRAEGALQRLDKRTGSQRQVGLIFPDSEVRQVFLGTLMLGDERRAMQYGQDESRDVVGYIERVGPQRWRLIMPEPHFESITDVMELVPAG